MENDAFAKIFEEFGIECMKNAIIKQCSDIRSTETKLDLFIDCYKNDLGRKFSTLSEKEALETITVVLLDGPLLLYAIGMNAASILELHSILERFSLRDVSRILAKPPHQSVVKKLLERSSLPDLAKILRDDLKILDEEEVKYAINLNKLRNGIAHKNERVISNALLSGKRISLLDIDQEVNRIDIKPLLLNGIAFMHKLFYRQPHLK